MSYSASTHSSGAKEMCGDHVEANAFKDYLDNSWRYDKIFNYTGMLLRKQRACILKNVGK